MNDDCLHTLVAIYNGAVAHGHAEVALALRRSIDRIGSEGLLRGENFKQDPSGCFNIRWNNRYDPNDRFDA